jgi:YVTN family beta-propeller protein
MRTIPAIALALACAALWSCSPTRDGLVAGKEPARGLTEHRLPTGAVLDPAGTTHDVGSLPLAAIPSPDGTQLVLSLNGWREQGIQIVDRATGAVRQTLRQPAAFVGLAFSPDGTTLYASGGNEDKIYVYAWHPDSATLTDSIVLQRRPDTAAAHRAALAKHLAWRSPSGVRYPAGLAISPDGKHLYVAENLGDSLAVVDLATHRVHQRLATERYPYAVAVTPSGTVYVTAWGGHTVSAFAPRPDGALAPRGRIAVARHPSALALSRDGATLYVASASTDRIDVIDTKTGSVTRHIDDRTPATAEGSTPDGLALSSDGSRLFTAEADNNAVAVIDLHADSVIGRIPVQWYPTAIAVGAGDTLYVVNGKGHGTGPNPTTGPAPNRPSPHAKNGNPYGYTLGQLSGMLSIIAPPDAPTLAAYTGRVARANGWTTARSAPSYPPIQHVLYIIRENRTYDQILGDVAEADGDSAIVFFGRAVTPNAHALAARFGIWDRFFVNAEVSGDGHPWSTGAYATDYVEKTVESNYSDRGRSYDYEGTNRDTLPPDGDDAAAPATGYLWDLAVAKGITLRDYGEFVVENGRTAEEGKWRGSAEGAKPALRSTTNPDFPPFDLSIPDQKRADVWIAELQQHVAQHAMPALEIMHLGNDHTAGARPGAPTPRAMVADNDLALGRIIEALSKTPFWAHTAVFVLEDDAQNGSDHVDSHRSPLLVISPYARRGVLHRFANTTDVIATIEELLGLGSLSQFDHYGRPLRDAFTTVADTTAYVAVTPSVPLTETNPLTGPLAKLSMRLRLHKEDESDERLFNTILWRAVKGDSVPEPAARRASMAELRD